jgi:hypothetical protein
MWRACAASCPHRLIYLELDAAVGDYDAALELEPKLPTSLYGCSLAKQKKGDNVGGNNDIAAAKKIRPDVDDEFTRYESIIYSPQQLERAYFAGLGAASARGVAVDGRAAATEGVAHRVPRRSAARRAARSSSLRLERLDEDHYQNALALAGAKPEEMTISRLRRNPDRSKNR